MNDLGFAIERRPHNLRGHMVAWMRDSRGVLRRATPEEEAMWRLLFPAETAEGEAPEKEEARQPRKGKR